MRRVARWKRKLGRMDGRMGVRQGSQNVQHGFRISREANLDRGPAVVQNDDVPSRRHQHKGTPERKCRHALKNSLVVSAFSAQ